MQTSGHRPKPRATARLNPLTGLGAFERFFRHNASSSYPLFVAAAAALLWANLAPHSYESVWHTELSFSLGPFKVSKSLVHWIDEALMTLFFFSVGLEIKREFLVGALSSVKKAILPIMAALGGMIFPAVIFSLINAGAPSSHGWGIPMATDIAFSLGILGLLGKRIPLEIKIFLSALAIGDDLGAVLVIAVFYTPDIVWSYLAAAMVLLALLAAANRLFIRSPVTYALLGLGLWIAVMGSGVHATVAGVLVATFIPGSTRFDTDAFISTVKANLDAFDCEPGDCGTTILMNPNHLEAVENIEVACEAVETPLQRMEHNLTSWISYLVLPLFALANAGLNLQGIDFSAALSHPLTLGVFSGLEFGKPLGILVFTFLGIKLFKAPMPEGAGWQHILGIGFLGGIGFTMSLFISGLSFNNPEFSDYAKLGIIGASFMCGIIGYFLLRTAKAPAR